MDPNRDIKNIALVGFMGTGKSSVGHLVARMLDFQFVDTDEMIERERGKRIAEIFAEEGEPAFREYERNVVQRLSELRRQVISTGGGLVTNAANLQALKEHSLVVCLWASPETIWHRVRHQSTRPLLLDPDPQAKIRQMLKERDPFYRQADILLSSEFRLAKDVAQHVVHEYRTFLSQSERKHPSKSAGPRI